MKKIEIIWRELLFQVFEKRNKQFIQKELAENFGFSTSTVFQALKPLRKMGAVRVGGRFFSLEDPEKLLYHWASIRDLERDIVIAGKVDLPVFEIEGRMPPGVVFGGFSAAREILAGDAAADYDKIYVYIEKTPNKGSKIQEKLQERFNLTKGKPNLFVLKADEFLSDYGQITTLAHTFVDLWNMPEWYAKEFTKALKEKIDELL